LEFPVKPVQKSNDLFKLAANVFGSAFLPEFEKRQPITNAE
jgi:hypothetical protein